ncbi:MAG: hypothetical protein ACT4QG_11605 [Sporichthyaceae bacterium]
MRARAQVAARPAAPAIVEKSVRSRKALAAAAVVVVLAAALAIAGLAAGTRAAQPDDLGRSTQHGVAVR